MKRLSKMSSLNGNNDISGETMKTFLRASCFCLLTTGTALAQSDSNIYGIYGSLGTEGVGAGVSFWSRPSWNLRAELNSLNTGRDINVDGTRYNLDIQHISQSVLYDYRPYQGSFRLTTGVGINQSRLDFNGRLTGSFPTFGNGADVRGRIELPPVMPYLGVGLGLGKTQRGIGFYADLGAYLGSPKLRSFETPPGVNADSERRSLEEELRSIKLYPVGKIGINYQF